VDVFTIIKDALIGLLNGLYPSFEVCYEEIPRTAGDDGTDDLEDYFFLEIIPTGSTTVDAYHTRHRLLVNIAAHDRAESNGKYLSMAHRIGSAVRPVFRFGDRAITVPEVGCKVVDKVLHCTFTLEFTDSVEDTEQFDLMEQLDTTIKSE